MPKSTTSRKRTSPSPSSRQGRRPTAAALAEPAAFAAALSLTESHAPLVGARILPFVSGRTYSKKTTLTGIDSTGQGLCLIFGEMAEQTEEAKLFSCLFPSSVSASRRQLPPEGKAFWFFANALKQTKILSAWISGRQDRQVCIMLCRKRKAGFFGLTTRPKNPVKLSAAANAAGSASAAAIGCKLSLPGFRSGKRC